MLKYFFLRLLLLIVSQVSLIILGIISFIYTLIRLGIKLRFKEMADYFYNIAFSYDQTGNVVCQYFFNDMMMYPDGHRFGNPDETISHVLGKGDEKRKLYKIGEWVGNKFLNIFEKDHIQKAAKIPQ